MVNTIRYLAKEEDYNENNLLSVVKTEKNQVIGQHRLKVTVLGRFFTKLNGTLLLRLTKLSKAVLDSSRM